MLIFEHDFEDGNWIKLVTKVYQPLSSKGEIPILEVKAANRPPMDILLFDMKDDKDFLQDLYLALDDYFDGKLDKSEWSKPPVTIFAPTSLQSELTPKSCGKCEQSFIPTSPAVKFCDNCKNKETE